MNKTDGFRICIILPENNYHSICFREVGLLLYNAIKSLGYACDFTFNQLAVDKINIILGYHLLIFENDLKNYCYIVYQLEQLNANENSFSNDMNLILQHACSVWDYSKNNITFLKTRGISATLLIPGYHPALEIIAPAFQKPIDILFYGSVGERRKKILNELGKFFELKVLFGVYGEKRDHWIGQAKLVLNIHHYSQQLFEAVRISYLLNNRILVLSEKSIDYPYLKVDLEWADTGNLAARCKDLLSKNNQAADIALNNYLAFKSHYSMTDLIRPLLKELPA
jgi:hypothetical protein